MKPAFLLFPFTALPVCAQTPKVAPTKNVAPDKAWSDKAWMDAAALLFAQGLDDPRRGEYRRITVQAPSELGDAGPFETRGWVLPGNATPRRALAWNGLVYPVEKVGPPADLLAEANALLAADKKRPGYFERKSPETGSYSTNGHPQFWHEDYSLAHTTLLPMKYALLWRAGQNDAARRVWVRWKASDPTFRDIATETRRTFLRLARDWAWAQWQRALHRHMSGDEAALSDLRSLQATWARIQARAKARGWTLLTKNDGDFTGRLPSFGFLQALPELLADEERRAKTPKRPLVATRLADYPDQAARIAALIEDLQEVGRGQSSTTVEHSLTRDPTLVALIAEGDAAVPALLAALDKDTRLTRGVTGWPDWEAKHFVKVYEAAFEALRTIFNSQTLGAASMGQGSSKNLDRAVLLADARAFWAKYGARPRNELPYWILADDAASPEQWVAAAVKIAPDAATWHDSVQLDWPYIKTHLRAKSAPSVSELLARRARELEAQSVAALGKTGGKTGGKPQPVRFNGARILAGVLTMWEPDAAAPLLRELFERNAALPPATKSPAPPDLPSVQAHLTLLRQKAGDARALADYTRWLLALPPILLPNVPDTWLQPLWQNPDDPDAKATVRALLTRPEFSPVPDPKLRPGRQPMKWLNTPLTGMDEVQGFLLKMLADLKPLGTVHLTKQPRAVAVQDSLGYYEPWRDDVTPDPQLPPLPKGKPLTVRYRVCDVIARQLSKNNGAPRCELYWSEKARDEAVARCAQTLRAYGANWRFSPLQERTRSELIWPFAFEFSDSDSERAPLMTFAPLDHPATADDVRAGRAIFTLEGQAEAPSRRAVKLPRFPLAARWKEQKNWPFLVPISDNAPPRTLWRQSGMVWQAEEIEQNGTWRRFYGFAGTGVLQKVPAEEIEFPAVSSYGAPGPSVPETGLRLQAVSPGIGETNCGWTWHLPKAGEPAVLKILLCNERGTPQTADNLRAVREKLSPTGGPGLRIHLLRPRGGIPSQPPKQIEGDENWEAMAPRDDKAVEWQWPATLEAGDRALVAQIDLAGRFDLAQPGYYMAFVGTPQGKAMPWMVPVFIVGDDGTAPFHE